MMTRRLKASLSDRAQVIIPSIKCAGGQWAMNLLDRLSFDNFSSYISVTCAWGQLIYYIIQVKVTSFIFCRFLLCRVSLECCVPLPCNSSLIGSRGSPPLKAWDGETKGLTDCHHCQSSQAEAVRQCLHWPCGAVWINFLLSALPSGAWEITMGKAWCLSYDAPQIEKWGDFANKPIFTWWV